MERETEAETERQMLRENGCKRVAKMENQTQSQSGERGEGGDGRREDGCRGEEWMGERWTGRMGEWRGRKDRMRQRYVHRAWNETHTEKDRPWTKENLQGGAKAYSPGYMRQSS